MVKQGKKKIIRRYIVREGKLELNKKKKIKIEGRKRKMKLLAGKEKSFSVFLLHKCIVGILY